MATVKDKDTSDDTKSTFGGSNFSFGSVSGNSNSNSQQNFVPPSFGLKFSFNSNSTNNNQQPSTTAFNFGGSTAFGASNTSNAQAHTIPTPNPFDINTSNTSYTNPFATTVGTTNNSSGFNFNFGGNTTNNNNLFGATASKKPNKPAEIIETGFNKEILTYGYIRTQYKSDNIIPGDISKLCLSMYGKDDIIWNIDIQELKALGMNEEIWSPIYKHNQFQFRLMVKLQRVTMKRKKTDTDSNISNTSFNFGGLSSSVYYEADAFTFYTEFIKASGNLLLNQVTLFSEIDVDGKLYRKIIKSSTGKLAASNASRIHSVDILKEALEQNTDKKFLNFKMNFNVNDLQLIDQNSNKMYINHRDFDVFRKYKFEWKLNLNKHKPDNIYTMNDAKCYYSPIFYKFLYLAFISDDSEKDKGFIQLCHSSLPFAISAVYVKWRLCVYQNEMTMVDETMYCDVPDRHGWSSAEFNFGAASTADSKCIIDVKLLDADKDIHFVSEIEIMQIKDRNFFSSQQNIIFKENLHLYGIQDHECIMDSIIDVKTVIHEIDNVESKARSGGFNFGNSNSMHTNPPTEARIKSDWKTDYKENRHIFTINYIARKLQDGMERRTADIERKHRREIEQLRILIESMNGSDDVKEDDILCVNKDQDEVKEWLRDEVGLLQYYDNFALSGFDSISMIKEIIDKKDLEYIGIDIKAHRIKIMNRIRRLTQSEN